MARIFKPGDIVQRFDHKTMTMKDVVIGPTMVTCSLCKGTGINPDYVEGESDPAFKLCIRCDGTTWEEDNHDPFVVPDPGDTQN